MSEAVEVRDNEAIGDTQEDEGFDTYKIRALVLRFYQRFDPIRLSDGLDVSGIVEWIEQNGFPKFNAVLEKQYKKKIDPNESLETVENRFKRTSMAVTPNLFPQQRNEILIKREKIKRQLKNFYKRMGTENNNILDESQAIQFKRLVNFAAFHGVPTLNILLIKKYGEGITEKDDVPDEEIDIGNFPDLQYAVDRDEIDMVRLKGDLTGYFSKVRAEDQLDVLEENIDWIMRMGFEQWNNKSMQLYGQRFDDVLIQLEREPWCGRDDALNLVLEPDVAAEEAQQRQITAEAVVATEVAIVAEVVVELLDFDELTDEEIKIELRAFYKFFDPDNLTKLDDLVKLARDLGREKLNAELMNLYGSRLKPDQKYVETEKLKDLKKEKNESIRQPQVGKEKEEKEKAKSKLLTEVPFKDEEKEAGKAMFAGKQQKPKVQGAYTASNASDEVDQDAEYALPEPNSKSAGGFGKFVSRRFGGKKNAKNKSLSSIDMKNLRDKTLKKTRESLMGAKRGGGGFVSFRKRGGKQANIRTLRTKDFKTAAAAIRERNAKGMSQVRNLDGTTFTKNIVQECTNYELDITTGFCKHCGKQRYGHASNRVVVNTDVDDTRRGSVLEMKSKAETRAKLNAPNRNLLNRLKLAQKDQDPSNPLLMLSSRNMRKVWNTSEFEEEVDDDKSYSIEDGEDGN